MGIGVRHGGERPRWAMAATGTLACATLLVLWMAVATTHGPFVMPNAIDGMEGRGPCGTAPREGQRQRGRRADARTRTALRATRIEMGALVGVRPSLHSHTAGE